MNNLYILFFLLIIILILIICSIIIQCVHDSKTIKIVKTVKGGKGGNPIKGGKGGNPIKGGNRENSKAKMLIEDLQIDGISLHKGDIIFVYNSTIVGYIKNAENERYTTMASMAIVSADNYKDIQALDYLKFLKDNELLVLEPIKNASNTSILRNPGEILDINANRDTIISADSKYKQKLHKNIPPIIPKPNAAIQDAYFGKYNESKLELQQLGNRGLLDIATKKSHLDDSALDIATNIKNNSDEHDLNISRLLNIQDTVIDTINSNIIHSNTVIDQNSNSMHAKYKQSEDNANKLKHDLKQLEIDLIKKNDREYAYASVQNSETISEFEKIKSFIADNEEDITGFKLKATKFTLNGKTYKRDDIIPYSEFINIIDKLPEGYILTDIPGNSYSHFG